MAFVGIMININRVVFKVVFYQWGTDISQFSNISWFPCNCRWMELPSLNGWQNAIMALCQKSGVANCSKKNWALGFRVFYLWLRKCFVHPVATLLGGAKFPWAERPIVLIYFRWSKSIGFWGFFFATSKHPLVYYRYSMKMVSRNIPSQSTHILAPGTQITSL